MVRIAASLLLASFATPLAIAQARPTGADWTPPRLTVSVGYAKVRSNAPPSACNCFGADGGYASAAYSLFFPWLRIAGEVTGSHANNISTLGQNLTLMTFTAGPQIVVPFGRFEVFGHGLFGGAHGSDSYFPSGNTFNTSATSFAISTGGGLDIGLTRHFGVRAAQVEYLRTSFPNNSNNEQNHTVFSAGLLMRFGHMGYNNDNSAREDAYKVQRDQERQARASAPPVVAAATPPPPPATSTTIKPPSPVSDVDFDSNTASAFFDYDSYDLRPDALTAVKKNAAFLTAHPDLNIVVAGYADERGTAEYNLALGQKRAQAVRDQLIADGVSASKLDVISYGKEKQTCSDEDEACFAKNRRASLENHTAK